MRFCTIFLSALLSAVMGVAVAVAQVAAPARLTDPHTVAIPAQNLASGVFTLASVPAERFKNAKYQVYVPPTCVGRRCPLLIFLPHDFSISWLIPAADKYGLIVLLPRFISADLRGAFERGERHPMTEELDTALREIYRRFAIDPDKIALLGRCGTTREASFWGYHNAKMFSRIIMSSGSNWHGGETWTNPATEFLFIWGLQESEWLNVIRPTVNMLRRQGVKVTQALGFRGHGHQIDDYLFIARWLHESWGPPAARRAPAAVADPLPLLTTDALAKMAAFWTWFQETGPAIRTRNRRQYQREVALPAVGDELFSIGMVDMGVLAAQSPPVARALAEAGLTAAEHDAYRIALASAVLLRHLRAQPVSAALLRRTRSQPLGEAMPDSVLAANVPAGSVLARNAEFVAAHHDKMRVFDVTSDRDRLKQNRMWYMP